MVTRSKKAEQLAAKKKHIDSLKNKRRAEPVLERQPPANNPNPEILIVCEGKNTEPSYLKQFKLKTATIVPVGTGHNTLSLVNEAIRLSKKKKYDQVWCVFDADPKLDNPKQTQNFDNAVKKAQANDFQVAYSNQAFEYWIILHFEDHQGGGMPRTDYSDKINALIEPYGLSYEESKMVSPALFDLMFEVIGESDDDTRTHLAIKRATKIHGACANLVPSKAESSTTVFKLVSELLEYM